MKLPTSALIGYRTYRIEPLSPSQADRDKVWGWHRPNEQRIQVQVDGPRPSQIANTMIHEILHACYSVCDLKDRDPEEKTVTMLSHALVQVWRDNPHIIKFINHLIKKEAQCGSISTSKPTTFSTKSLASGASVPSTSTPKRNGRSGRGKSKTA